MKIYRKSIGWAAAGLAILFAVGNAGAQVRALGPGAAPPPPPGRGMQLGDIGFGGFEAGLGGKTVANAPFTATFSTQTSQALNDGNQIQRTTTGTIARDSAGRTRRDLTLSAIGPWAASGKSAPHVVIINDPVAKVQYILDPDRKVARKVAFAAGELARTERHTAAGWFAAESERRNDSKFGNPVHSRRKCSGNAHYADNSRGRNRKCAGPHDHYRKVAFTRPADRRADQAHRSAHWFALFQLTNIVRQEPDPTLFQVPSDYTVQDSRDGGGRRGRRPPAGANGSGAPPQN